MGLKGLEAKFDEIGGPETEPHVPVGWAWAADTPFQWTKQVASHFGGTRNGLIVHWPKGIAAKGELRSQFHHVIDIAPTVLEAAGIREPQVVNGVKQKPIEGVSMRLLFRQRAAAKSRRTDAIFRDARQPRHLQGRLDGHDAARPPAVADGRRGHGRLRQDTWELYNIDDGLHPGR